MKRFIAIICSAAILLSFSACGKNSTGTSTEASSAITASETTTTASTETEIKTTTETSVTEETTTAETTIAETSASETTVQTTAKETTTVTTVTTTETTTVTTTVKTSVETKPETTTAKTTAETSAATTKTTIATEAETTAKKKPVSADWDMTTEEIVADMGIGINLGNTYEACGDWIAQWGDGTPESYETAWGSPVITKAMIKGYKDAGFGVLRVPVAWSNMMGENYTISKEYTAAVREVVDWALECDLYVIVNLHWDNGWMEKFPTETDECMKRYKKIWKQVSAEFADYDHRLMFESQNEELGWSSVWNPWGGTNGKAESYALVNKINQAFVDVVRSSGGNNDKRHLLISGYNTNIDHTCDSLFKMPDDPAKRCAVSVHYYDPASFAILTEDADWGKAQRTWGTASEKESLSAQLDKMKKNFTDKGIPVIIGEYGCPTENKDMDSVRLYLSTVCNEAYKRGLCPVLWSTPGGHYDRNTCKMIDSELAEKFKEITD